VAGELRGRPLTQGTVAFGIVGLDCGAPRQG